MKCKVFILYILSLISFLLLFGCFGISLYGWISYRQLDNSNNKWFFIIMLVFVGLICFYALISVIGAYGIHQKNQNYVKFYAVMIFISILVFLAGAISAIKLAPLLKKQHCTDGDLFDQLQLTSAASIFTLCYNCQCYIQNQTLESNYNILIRQSLKTYAPRISTTNSTLPTKVQDCSNWNVAQYSQFSNILQSLQNNFQCSGWCKNSNSLFFRFSDTHKGIPSNTCYNMYQKFITQAGLIIEILFFILTGISVLKLLVSCLVDVRDNDNDSQIENYKTNTEADHTDDKSNTNVIFAQRRPEQYPYYQPKIHFGIDNNYYH